MNVRKAQHAILLGEHLRHHLIGNRSFDVMTEDALGNCALDYPAAL
jgi:hypothetical protein